MISIIAKLIKLFSRDTTSLLEALKSVISKYAYKDLLLNNHDFRKTLNYLATKMQVAESELAKKVSQRFKIPYLARLFPIDITLLPTGITLQDCRLAGCLPIYNEGSLRAIACVDPLKARELFSDFKYLPLGFSLWLTIAKALDESERLFLSKQTSQHKNATSIDSFNFDNSIEVRRVLELVCREIIEHKGITCTIQKTESAEVEYRIKLPDHREAKGKIHPRVWPSLEKYLEDFASNNKIYSGLNDIKILILTRHSSVGSYYELKLLDRLRTSNLITFRNFSTSVESEINSTLDSFEEIQKLVLIIDDNPIFARVLEKFLAKFQISTFHSPDAEKALCMLAEKSLKPAAIVCDVHMPGMNGFGFIRGLREQSDFCEIPLLMLTSDEDIETELKLINEGADAFITKSSDPRLLSVHIRRLLERETKRTAA